LEIVSGLKLSTQHFQKKNLTVHPEKSGFPGMIALEPILLMIYKLLHLQFKNTKYFSNIFL